MMEYAFCPKKYNQFDKPEFGDKITVGEAIKEDLDRKSVV